jgi:hypothetical protein
MYQRVTADPYLHAFPGGYPGIELLKFLGGIIESREPQECQWSTASKFGFAETLHMAKMSFITLSLWKIGAPVWNKMEHDGNWADR